MVNVARSSSKSHLSPPALGRRAFFFAVGRGGPQPLTTYVFTPAPGARVAPGALAAPAGRGSWHRGLMAAVAS